MRTIGEKDGKHRWVSDHVIARGQGRSLSLIPEGVLPRAAVCTAGTLNLGAPIRGSLTGPRSLWDELGLLLLKPQEYWLVRVPGPPLPPASSGSARGELRIYFIDFL